MGRLKLTYKVEKARKLKGTERKKEIKERRIGESRNVCKEKMKEI